MKKNFDVTGMTCSACSNRVEKAVSHVPGVEDVNVNLLKNSMTVDYVETKTGLEQIIQAVTQATVRAKSRLQVLPLLNPSIPRWRPKRKPHR